MKKGQEKEGRKLDARGGMEVLPEGMTEERMNMHASIRVDLMRVEKGRYTVPKYRAEIKGQLSESGLLLIAESRREKVFIDMAGSNLIERSRREGFYCRGHMDGLLIGRRVIGGTRFIEVGSGYPSHDRVDSDRG